MSSPTTTVIHSDIGLAFNTLDATTTTTIKRLITKAQNRIKNITGTTSGAIRDDAIRSLADAFTVTNALANIDPNKDNMEAFIQMRDNFIKDTNDSLRLIGFTLDGIKIQFTHVNP